MSRRSPNEPTGPPQGRIAPKRDSAEGTPLNDSDAPSRYLRIAAPALIAVLLLAAWQGLVVAYDVPPYIVPSPKRLLANALSVTLGIALTALALATVVGTGIALLFVQSRWIEMSLFPYAVLLQVTPIVAIAPLIIIWVKDTRVALILCAGVVAIFPIISNTTLGLRSADHGLVNLFRMCRASRWQVLLRLRIPGALPYFFGGLRIASGLALIGAIVAEFVAGTGGQGAGLAYQILLSGMQLNIPRLFAALFLIAAAGIALYACTIWLSHVMLSRWHESEAAAPG
jgi:NitT/TauT family transport system permease protein